MVGRLTLPDYGMVAGDSGAMYSLYFQVSVKIFDQHDVAFEGNGVYDVSPDGQRFLFVKANVENGPPDEVRVVLNWTEELKQLAPSSKQP